MPLMHSGAIVSLDNDQTPTLVDIGLGLSRQPRFAGQTRQWWSVLDHTLFMAELAGPDPGLKLAALLHDAHEALTGDCPTGLKPHTLRDIQNELDVRIMAAHYPGGIAAYRVYHDCVKELDARALYAEARVVGPPGFAVMSGEEFIALMGGFPSLEDGLLLWELLGGSVMGRPEHLVQGAFSPAVDRFLELCHICQDDMPALTTKGDLTAGAR